MHYTFHCYKSKLGWPDLIEATETVENLEPATETIRREMIDIANDLITFNPEIEIFSNSDERVAEIQNQSIDQVKTDYFHLSLHSQSSFFPSVYFLNQSISLTIQYPWNNMNEDDQVVEMQNLIEYFKIITNKLKGFVFDEQSLEVFDPFTTKIEIEEGIIIYKKTNHVRDENEHYKSISNKKKWWKF